MRLLIDAILGLLACVSLIFPWLSQVKWEEAIFYVFVALLLGALILLLHLKPNDNAESNNTEKLMNVAQLRPVEPLGKVDKK
jgi:hypothetical protein